MRPAGANGAARRAYQPMGMATARHLYDDAGQLEGYPMRRMHTNGLAMFGVAGVLCACGAALGQNALGDGRALDANLHATQGRLNPTAPGINSQLRFNNAVIYGTAPDGKSFRGSVGYRAPNQFEGSVGSDTLYNFKRDSFTSGLASSGVRGSDALRYQFALTTGQYVPGFLAPPTVSVPREGNVATISNSTSSSTALRSTSDFYGVRSTRPALVGAKQDEYGAEYVAKASPLLGVSWVKTAESPLGVAPPSTTTVPPGAVPTAPTTPTVPGTTPPPTPATPGTPKPIQTGLSGLETSAAGVGKILDSGAIDTRVPPISLKASSELHEQLLTRFRDNFGEPNKPGEVGAKPAPEPKSFDEQMKVLRQRMSGQIEQPEKPVPKYNADGTRRFDTPKPGSKPGAKPESNPQTPPTKDNGEKAPGDKQNSDVSPEMAKALKKAGDTKLEHLIADAPRPGKEHGDAEGYRLLMREAEGLMAKSRFFDAEDRFTRAIAAQPRDPMARIGRVHAEIGGGLYLSAVANLRAVFTDSPELVGTRYSPTLLPTESRMQTIVEQLSIEEKKAESLLGRESALLMAYVGYQRGDQKLIKQGLDDFDNRVPQGEAGLEDRALLGVVRAAWTSK